MYDLAGAVYNDIIKHHPTDGEAIKGAKDSSARASMHKQRWDENANMRDLMRDSSQFEELEKASRTGLTREQLEALCAEARVRPRFVQNRCYAARGWDADGQPLLRAPVRPITVNHLMLHTSGLAYEFFSADEARYRQVKGVPSILACNADAIKSALLFDPGDAAGIASAMARLLDDAPLARQLVQRGLAQARRFSWDQAAAGVLAQCRQAAAP